DAGIDFRARRAEFERRKDPPRDTARDRVAHQFQRLLFPALHPLVRVRPQEAMAPRLRRRRDALADRLENLGLAEIWNYQAKQQGIPGPLPRAAHKRPPTRPAAPQAPLLQLAHRPPHRDPRGAEALHQRRLAGEFLARRVMPAGDVALQALAYLLVHRLGGNRLRHDKAVISAFGNRVQPAIIGIHPISVDDSTALLLSSATSPIQTFTNGKENET